MMISLNGEWKLRFCKEDPDMPPESEWREIPAIVPGNVELDLFRAGIEKEPFFGENIYDYRKYEFYRWIFTRDFDMPDNMPKRMDICFEGINTFADIYINNTPVGHCENSLIEHTFDVSYVVKPGKNTIRVVISSANNIAKDYDYPVNASSGGENSDDYLMVRKPPSAFGWDIMARFPSAGMWRGVSIRERRRDRLTQTYYATLSCDERHAAIVYKYRFKAYNLSDDDYAIRVTFDGKTYEKKAFFVSGEGEIHIDNPKLWWPRGYGEQNLYDIKMELLKGGRVVDEKSERIGIRTIDIDHKMAAGDDGEFLIKVNGCPILAKGSNWVPLDALHSRDAERYDRALALFYEAGCNIVRCWGGNVYEDHRFYDLCDEYGILVWQDFTMACAIYPQTDEFIKIIEDEATQVIRKLRNHPSIMLWAGDNEVDESYIWHGYKPMQNRYNSITREALPRAVRANDPFRMYLPSSPYIDEKIARYNVPEQHNWGARAYFKDDFYKHSNAHFISECGYHGCPAPESLAKFIPADKLWPYTNGVWDTHDTDYMPKGGRGYNRNQLMADQVEIMFGKVPDNLETFSALSQIVQAEAKKFFVERTRIKKWRRSGIIWWNMLDGWPQISDAIVDYYFVKKRAFNYIKRIQQSVCVMLDELVDWTHDVVLGNDSRKAANVTYRVIDGDTGETLLSGEEFSPANENVKLGALRIMSGDQKLILIEWTIDGVRYTNHYITGFPHYDAETMLKWAEKIDKWAE